MTKKLKLTDERPYFKPFHYPWAYDYWLQHENVHWLFQEVPMHEDVKDWQKRLTDSEKTFLTNIFRFFTQGDIDVSEGYVKNYLPFFPHPEVRMMLCGIAAREALHVAAYAHLIETLGMPETIYNEFHKYKEMEAKHKYFEEMAAKDSNSVIQQMLAVSMFTEGLQLFASFAMLLNFPRHGLMKGMGQIVTWSIVDESMHCEAMTKLFRTFVEENRKIWNDELKSELYSIAEKMVELEDAFIDLAFSMGDMKGLTAEQLKKYIRFIADRRLISVGLKGIFKHKKNPLPWVDEMINTPIHGNFFENRVTDYAKGAMTGSWGDVWGHKGA